jgi:hypothetical protein
MAVTLALYTSCTARFIYRYGWIERSALTGCQWLVLDEHQATLSYDPASLDYWKQCQMEQKIDVPLISGCDITANRAIIVSGILRPPNNPSRKRGNHVSCSTPSPAVPIKTPKSGPTSPLKNKNGQGVSESWPLSHTGGYNEGYGDYEAYRAWSDLQD